MALPVSGPFSRTESLNSAPYTYPDGGVSITTVYFKEKEWYRQAKPYDRPLPFVAHVVYVVSDSPYYGDGYPSFAGTHLSTPFNSDAYAKAYSKAYNKAVSAMGEQSNWSVNGKEWRQSLSLISEPALSLWRFSRHLRRGDFRGAARQLKTAVPRGLKDSAKSFGNNWLKFHLGVEPLIKDIHAGLDTLQQPLPVGKVRVRGSDYFERLNVHSGEVDRIDFRVKTGVTIGYEFEVTNPNLFKANQLGLVNPAAFAWEIIPFSFVVDWFANVGQFLSSFTDFAGVSVVRPYTSYKQTNLHRHFRDPSYSAQASSVIKDVYVKRSLSLSLPTLTTQRWKAPSPVRAATAISLLLQQLR